MQQRLLIYVLFIIMTTGLVHPASTLAEGVSKWGILPVPGETTATTAKGYFIYSLEAGAQANGQLLLRNPGTTPVTINLSAVNAETAQRGGSAFVTEDGSTSGVATWIILGQRQATLAPGTEHLVPFAVHAPVGAKPGQYLAGIAASEAVAAKAEETVVKPRLGANITMRSRYVIAVEADIVGVWKPSLKIENVDVLDRPSGASVGIQLLNSGDTFLKPSGTIIVTDAVGKQLLSQPIEMGTFVPGTAITYPVRWPGKPAPGTYNVAVKLNYADGKTATYDDSFDVTQEVAQKAEERALANDNAATNVVQAAAAPSPIQPWMIYAFGALLVLIVVLLALNLVRGRAKQQSS